MQNTETVSFERMPYEISLLKAEVNALKNIIIDFTKKLLPQADNNKNNFIDINEVAKITFKSINTIYSLTSKKAIPFYKNRNRLYFEYNEIQEWIITGIVKTKQNLDDEVDNIISNKRKTSIK
jgi:predicted DNA-binding transcriptional regulator AlpA